MQTLTNKVRAQELYDTGAIEQQEYENLLDGYHTVDALNSLIGFLQAYRRSAMYQHKPLAVGSLELVMPSDILGCTLAKILSEMPE